MYKTTCINEFDNQTIEGISSLTEIPILFTMWWIKLKLNPIYQPLHSGRIWHKVNF